jgi:hypothetical protein
MVTTAAIVFAVGTAVVILFQIALAFGAPWGEFTLGGRHRGQLPGAWRLVPVVSLLLLLAFVWVVLIRAGITGAAYLDLSRTLIWFVVGYCALGCVANTMTPSPRERMIWLPVVALMFVCSVYVAWYAAS